MTSLLPEPVVSQSNTNHTQGGSRATAAADTGMTVRLPARFGAVAFLTMVAASGNTALLAA